MKNFAAIDFETANGSRSSVCSVGIIIVKDGKIVDSFYSLIKPYPNYYTFYCTRVHNLTRRDTDLAPSFAQVWQQVAHKLEGLTLVAHNSRFDESCLKAVFEAYNMPYPNYTFIDTLAFSRQAFPFLENHQLHTVSAHCGYTLSNHHHALADAEACAHIALQI